jgi:ABC-type lipoprotein release transport system permease subunit
VFGVDWVRGNRKTALTAPNTIVLSQRYAEKYFGNADPMGKTVRFDHQADLTVTGIIKNPPSNTQLRFDGFVSFATLPGLEGGSEGMQFWGKLTSMCFVVLREGVPAERLRGIFPALTRQHYGPGAALFAFHALPLRELNHQRSGSAPRPILYTLIAVGVFLVAAACINFVNVATARALRRAREIGVRKAVGSSRRQLVTQFLLETTVITGVAVVVALGLTQALLPLLNNALSMLGADLSVFDLLRPGPLGWFTGLVVGVIVLAGLYPAVVQAAFRPVEALKGRLTARQAGSTTVRRGLVVGQFFITQFFLIGVIVLVAQLRYMQRADLGFRPTDRLIVPLPTGDPLRQETLRHRLLQIPGVEGLTRCDAPPLSPQNGPHPFSFGTQAAPQKFSTRLRAVDRAYLPLFGLRLLAGRNFQADDTTRREVLVNATMTRQLGLASPDAALGQRLHVAGRDHVVVGVVADFHSGHFREPIHPLTLVSDVRQCRMAVLKVNAAYLPGAVATVKKTWNAAFPQEIFKAQFVVEMVTSLYSAERIMLGLAQAFALVAVLIGCLGLYGLVTFMAAAKTKEIGIRKVLGAGVPQLLWLFGREFGKLIGLGFVPAAVLGGLLMNGWLQGYAYRISLGWWVFALALGLVTAITLLTVWRESLRAALQNPARSLRTE